MTEGFGDAVTGLFDALAAGDVTTAISVVERAREVAVQRDLFDSLYAPAMALLGGAWADGSLDEYAFARAAVAADQIVSFVTSAPASQDSGVTVVIGVMHGDGHRTAKNIVGSSLRMAGHRVVDLGDSVSGTQFAKRAKDAGADIVIVCAEQLSSAYTLPRVPEALAAAGLSEVLVFACGGPFSADSGLARVAGAHGVMRTAEEAVELVQKSVARTSASDAEGASP